MCNHSSISEMHTTVFFYPWACMMENAHDQDLDIVLHTVYSSQPIPGIRPGLVHKNSASQLHCQAKKRCAAYLWVLHCYCSTSVVRVTRLAAKSEACRAMCSCTDGPKQPVGFPGSRAVHESFSRGAAYGVAPVSQRWPRSGWCLGAGDACSAKRPSAA